MKIIITSILGWFALASILTAQPAIFEWAGMAGNPTIDDTRTAVAAMGNGDYVVTGEFSGEAMFGEESLISTGGSDIYLARYNGEGNLVWLIGEGGADNDYIESITVDDDRNIYVTGYFYGTTSLGEESFTSAGSQDIFLAKFNQEGGFEWALTAGGEMADHVSAVAAGPEGAPVIGGHFYNAISIGNEELVSIGGSDIFIAAFSSTGTLAWTQQFSGSSSDGCSDLDINGVGQIFLSGSFYGDIQVGDFVFQTEDPVGVFHCKMDPGGTVTRAGQLYGTNLDISTCIRADQSGNFYLTGNFSDQVTFGTEVFDAGAFNLDVFIAKYTGNGTLLWASHGHSSANDEVVGLDLDSGGNAFITGHFLLDITFEDLTIPYTLCCGSREIYIVSYSADGDVAWGKQIAGARSGMDALCLVTDEALVTSGYFTDTISFDDISLLSIGQYRNFTSCVAFETLVKVPDGGPEALKTFAVFPNPVRQYLKLKGITDQTCDVSIFTLEGAMALTGRISPGQGLYVGHLPAGQYIVTLQGKGLNTLWMSSFIKM